MAGEERIKGKIKSVLANMLQHPQITFHQSIDQCPYLWHTEWR